MLGLTYEDICAKIKETKGLHDDEIAQRIKEKIEKLSGLISKEGAAHILANELGINLADYLRNKGVKIQRIVGGMRNLTVLGKVLRVYDVRTFTKQGKEGKVGSFLLGDETGAIRVVLWDTQQIQLLEQGQLSEGTIVKFTDGGSRQNQQFLELHLSSQSQITLNPAGETVTVRDNYAFSRSSAQRKKIHELTTTDTFIQLFGTVVQVFEPRFYEGCPTCNKKVLQGQCSDHGTVAPKFIPLLSFYLDDGTSNIRAVAFRDAVLKLLSLSEDALLPLRENPLLFEQYKPQFLGKQLLLTGKVTSNEQFQRMEFLVQQVDEPDPEQLAQEFVKEAPSQF